MTFKANPLENMGLCYGIIESIIQTSDFWLMDKMPIKRWIH